jgi:hypothetical protein
MKTIVVIPAIAACLVLGGATASIAQQPQSTAGAYGAGTAAAGRDGAVARGVTGTDASERAGHRKDRNRRDRSATAAPSSSTYGSGAVYTNRNSSSAAVTSGGAATGPNAATSTTVDAYGETTKDGSSADIYGNSNATVGPRPR